ncbi:hypothetical protein GCM10027258_10850 [Amycolatopsis stemonae]
MTPGSTGQPRQASPIASARSSMRKAPRQLSGQFASNIVFPAFKFRFSATPLDPVVVSHISLNGKLHIARNPHATTGGYAAMNAQ